MFEARKISNRISAAQKRTDRTRSLIRPRSCDLFFVALCLIDLTRAEKAAEDLSNKSRAVVLLKTFRQIF
jgi:hypothetical protein